MGVCYKKSHQLTTFINQHSSIIKHDDYIEPQKFYGSKIISPVCSNQQIFDLGYTDYLSLHQPSQNQLDRFLKELDRRFEYGLVLIQDLWFESLILLQEDLNLKDEDIITFKVNSAKPMADRVNIPKNQEDAYRQKVESINYGDALIYRHFRAKLLKKSEAYNQRHLGEFKSQFLEENSENGKPPTPMELAVKNLKRKTAQQEKLCIDQEKPNLYFNWQWFQTPDSYWHKFYQQKFKSDPAYLWYFPWTPKHLQVKILLPNPKLRQNSVEYQECRLKLVSEKGFADLLRHQQNLTCQRETWWTSKELKRKFGINTFNSNLWRLHTRGTK